MSSEQQGEKRPFGGWATDDKAEHDAKVRSIVYTSLAALTVVVLVTLGYLETSGIVFAAGHAYGLEEVALKLDQGMPVEAMQKLREVAPLLRQIGFDAPPEVDAQLQQIRRIDINVYVEALRYMSGRQTPQAPPPDTTLPEA